MASKPLPAAALLIHPAFKTNDWSQRLPPTSSGQASINQQGKRPGGPFSIYYEIHGTGPTKIVWIMGLGAFYTAWKRQTRYFGHQEGRGERYSCLVFDNRGVGRSGKPVSRYSSREMAGDVVELLGHVGWLDSATVSSIMGEFYAKTQTTRSSPGQTQTQITRQEALGDTVSDGDGDGNGAGAKNLRLKPQRTINIAGISMGGMIAQELALLIPAHIQSLILISTCPRLVRTVPFLENLRQRINMFVPRAIDQQLTEIAHRLFSDEFLARRDEEEEEEALNFPTIQDRFAASELAKRMDKEGFTRMGFMCQAVAAGWHAKSREELWRMVRDVGEDRVFIMHGTEDRMITFRHFELFREEIVGVVDEGERECGVKFRSWEGVGHVITWEREGEFNEAVEEFLKETEALGQ